MFLLSSRHNLNENAKMNYFWDIISQETPVFMFEIIWRTYVHLQMRMLTLFKSQFFFQLLHQKSNSQFNQLDVFVEFIPFFIFHFLVMFLVKLTKKQKNQLSFSGKMRILIQKINKQDCWFFQFWTKKWKRENRINRHMLPITTNVPALWQNLSS